MKKLPSHIIVFGVGIFVILISPYIPEVFFKACYYSVDRYQAVIPAFRLTGLLLAVYGLVLKLKGD